MKITLIELPATIDGRLHGILSNDVYSLVKLPSRAIDLLAAIAREAGYNDIEAINPSSNPVRGRFTLKQMKRIVSSNVVGISTITRTAPQSYELADHIKKINPEALIIMGGPHVSAMPKEALEHCDIVICNEGDRTFVEILDQLDFRRLPRPLRGLAMTIPGIVYKNKDGEMIRTAPRPFLSGEELSDLPLVQYSKETLKWITHTVLLTSRGCPYECEYCSVIANFGRRFRFVEIERVIEMIEHTISQARKPIFFGDDNFTAVPERTKRLLEEILRRGIKMPPWLTQVRVESARDAELLKLMKRTNCGRVCIGFESVNNETLKLLHKNSSVEKNTFAIQKFHEAGISIHGMFIVGADTDTKETVKQTAEYAKKNRIDTAQFITLIPLPGTVLTKKFEEGGRVISHEWHRYDGHHVVIKPEKMTAAELHDANVNAWLDFYSPKEALKHLLYGTEHWFNFMVRMWGHRLARRFSAQGSYYRRALSALDEWNKRVMSEYDLWAEKVDALAKDVKSDVEVRRAKARTELEKVLQMISEKREAIDEYFAPYKQKILEELEKMMQKRLAELALAAPA